ncbi:hypothetical protein ARAM_005916 [Aspergillus rambellii]|uniref:Uncharacterized protein n=1 Tax=Aspergillus rambellii TaxID=308745 RepID=A0A0F8XRD7_9EURO|nr:hypothetical protein ARAM_005916 [Aspergillus rambellii]
MARRSSSPMPCRIAIMSKNKLHKEAAAKDPDLRRCLGHHRLLRRSIQEAHSEMQKYMASVRLESDDDEDIFDDDDEEEPQPQPQPTYQFPSPPSSTHTYTHAQTQTQTPTAQRPEPTETDSDSPGSVIRDQITAAMRAMIKRRMPHTTPSNHREERTPPEKHALARVSSRNKSSPDISIPIEIEKHSDLRLEKAPSVASRGRKYASRLVFRRRCSPAPLQAITT